MASIASANRPSLRKSYPNISIHKDARADFRLPNADSKSNVVIHLKGFASYLDFENHQDTKKLGNLLIKFVSQRLAKSSSTLTLVWDGDPYDKHSFTSLIPKIFDSLLPRKTFLVAFVQREDKYDTLDDFLRTWGCKIEGKFLPIRLYLTQNFGGYEAGDPFALLGQLALNCTGSTCVVVFGGGNCVKEEYERGHRAPLQWYVFPAARYHKKKRCWESSSIATVYSDMSNVHISTLQTMTRPSKRVKRAIGKKLPTTIRITNIRLLRKKKLLKKEDLWFHVYDIYDRQGRKSEVIDAQKHFWKASEENQDFAADIVIDGRGCICCAGFVDLQLNGAFGVDFTNTSLDKIDVEKVCTGILAHGVTSFLPTVITSPPSTYRSVLPTLRSVKHCQEVEDFSGLPKGARILGIHLEGPFINPGKKGAHDAKFIQPSAKNLIQVYGEENMPDVKLVTIAPEIPGAMEAIKKLKHDGVVTSIGHTLSSIEQGMCACRNGASKITHLFNAMNTFHHRDPGIVGLLGLESQKGGIHYGIIPDGFHAHPSSVKIAYDAHPSGAIIVTDAMCAMGLGVGSHRLGTKEVTITECTTLEGRKGKRACISGNPETLAGSVVSMIEGVLNFKTFTKCSLEEALYAATFSPAETINVQARKGHLCFGADADFLLIDPSDYSIVSTYIDGKKVYDVNEKG